LRWLLQEIKTSVNSSLVLLALPPVIVG